MKGSDERGFVVGTVSGHKLRNHWAVVTLLMKYDSYMIKPDTLVAAKYCYRWTDC